MQISQVKSSCKLALKELSRWMIPEKVINNNTFMVENNNKHFMVERYCCGCLNFDKKHNLIQIINNFQVKTSLTTYPSSAEIVSEPLGVVLVISTWNFPFCKYKRIWFHAIQCLKLVTRNIICITLNSRPYTSPFLIHVLLVTIYDHFVLEL